MFHKPIRVKSNTQMKNSERKVLKNRIIQNFSSISESDMEPLFSTKDSVTVSKIITHCNSTIIVYSLKKRPMFFQHDEILYPTVYFLWLFPNILPCFTTHAPVVAKLSSGADLMLPGVVLPEIEGPYKYGQLQKGVPVAVNVASNKAPVAVGTTAHSSMDMYMAAGRGKCVNILHTICDHLCQMEGTALPSIPELGPPDWLSNKNDTSNASKEKNKQENGRTTSIEGTSEPETVLGNTECQVVDVTEELENKVILSDTDEMDQLLSYCFLKVLKYSRKKITLPVLASNFYRLHIINSCPEGKMLDIKKSKYKKLSKFLAEMKSEGMLEISEQTKGVESIVSINFDHPSIATFFKDADDINESEVNPGNQSSALRIEEAYVVTAPVLPIFADSGLRKGDSVKAADVRKIVSEYVRKRKLNSLDNRGMIIPNKELTAIVKTDDATSWEETMQKIFQIMSSSYKINSGTTQLSGKGKIEPITITVGSRSGNKKVTLVDNLELYAIRPSDFGKECQHGVAASTTVTKPAGKKYDQLLIQGNQVAFVGNLLTGKYNIPKRFIRGLELAVKNKK